MACCNKRVNQSHMKILSIILALFATSFAVHAQTYTKAELTQAAYNIQQGHNEGAKICLTYKAQVEASKAWTEEIRRNYLFTRVRDNIQKSKEQKNIQPTKGGHKMVTC